MNNHCESGTITVSRERSLWVGNDHCESETITVSRERSLWVGNDHCESGTITVSRERSLWVRNDHCESITSKQASTTRNTARTESVHHYSCLLIYIYIYIYWYLLQWRIDGWSSCNFGGSFTGPFEPSQNMFCGDGPGIKLVWCVIGRSCFGHQDWWNCCTKEDANGKWKRWLFFCILLHFYFRFILYDLYDTLLCRCCVHCTNIYIYVQNTCCGPSIPFYRQSVCVVESVQNTCCGPSIPFYRQSVCVVESVQNTCCGPSIPGPSPRSRGSARPKTASSLILRGHV